MIKIISIAIGFLIILGVLFQLVQSNSFSTKSTYTTDQDKFEQDKRMIPESECGCWDKKNRVCLPQSACI